jgi:ADP-heptose:LPS heptosyltransferase
MFRKVPRSEYQRLARSRFSVQSVIGARNPVDYTVNAPLEAGVNLRDIDAHSKLDEFVDLGLPASVEREDYLCLFVAGAKSINVWKPDVWAKHAMYLARRLGVARIALIGAEWDRAVQSEVHRILALRHEVVVYVGSPLEQTLDIIRRSRYFFGYQSGLNVLAENYNVPQLMVYFPKLRSMLYTWCKPMSVRTIFHAMTFDCDAAKVIDALPLGISDEARTA